MNFQYRTQGAAAAVYGFTGGSFERAILNPILISYLENLGLIILLVNFLMLTPFLYSQQTFQVTAIIPHLLEPTDMRLTR